MRQVKLRLVTDIGQRVSCWGCAHLVREVRGDEFGPLAGMCTFHELAFETKASAQANGCTYWQRRRRGQR